MTRQERKRSMQPKVEAALEFVTKTSRKAAITSTDAIEACVEGTAGTQFLP